MVNLTYRINFVVQTVITFERKKDMKIFSVVSNSRGLKPHTQNLSCLWLKIMAKLHLK